MPFWPRGCCSRRRRPVMVPRAVDRATLDRRRPPAACARGPRARCLAETTPASCELQRQDDRGVRLRGRAVPPLWKGRRLREPSGHPRPISAGSAIPRRRKCQRRPTRKRHRAGVRSPQPGRASSGTTTEFTGPVPSRRQLSGRRRRIHRIFRWRIPARADGQNFVVAGFLGYAPTPQAETDDGTSPWLLAVVIGTTLLAAVALERSPPHEAAGSLARSSTASSRGSCCPSPGSGRSNRPGAGSSA